LAKHQIKERSLKIIGGEWRSRVIDFAEDKTIRPTPVRIRETLFNWLQLSVPGARCLELYCGSGILSIEALSRGAKHVTMIDQSREAISKVKQSLKELSADPARYHCEQAFAQNWLSQENSLFDIIFLDPPFESPELESLLPLIKSKHLLSEDGFIYIESPQAILAETLPEGWTIYRNKKAAKVHYCLITKL